MREAIEELKKGWRVQIEAAENGCSEGPSNYKYNAGLITAYSSCIGDLDKVIQSNSPDPRQDMIKGGLDQRETDVEPNSAGLNPAAGSGGGEGVIPIDIGKYYLIHYGNPTVVKVKRIIGDYVQHTYDWVSIEDFRKRMIGRAKPTLRERYYSLLG